MHGMDECWFCQEPVTEPQEPERLTAVTPIASVATVERASVATTQAAPIVVDSAPVVHEPESAPPVVPLRGVRSPNRVRKRRVVVRSVLVGILAAAGAAAWEASSTRNVPPAVESVRFSSASLEGVGCDVSYPEDWRRDEAKRHASFLSDERDGDLSLRGFRVTRTAVPLGAVRDQLAEQEDKFRTYEAISTEDASVDEQRTIRHVFLGDGLRFEQWWVKRDKRSTIRLDLWSRPADDDALEINARIVRSLDVR